MLKKIILLLIAFLMFMPSIILAKDEPIKPSEQLKAIDLNEAEDIITNQSKDYKNIFNNITMKSLTSDLMKNGWRWDISKILKSAFAFYMNDVYANTKIMLIVILLSILSALITNMQNSFEQKGISEIAFYICFVIIAGIAVKGFTFSVDSCKQLIENLSLYIKTLVPLVMSISVAGGSLSGAAMFQPSILIATQIMTSIIKSILIPLLMLAVGVAIVNNISGKMQLTKMVELIKKCIKWTLGIMLTAFVTIMSVQALIAPVLDGATAKSAKFAFSNFIPIVGGVLAESISVVVNYSLILKNVVGVAGLIITLLMCFGPLVEIIALVTIFHFTAAVIQPISDPRLSNTITEIASCMSTLFLIVVSLELVFLVNLTIAIMASNSAVMLGR